MSAEEGNGLSVQSLAQRLETQDHRLEVLERENAELRSKVATLEKSGTRRDELAEKRGSETPRDGEPATEEFARRVSRRALLSKAGAAALGAVAAGTLLNPREAQAATNGAFNHVEVNYKEGSNFPSAVEVTSPGRGVNVYSTGGDAVYAVASPNGGRGVFGYSWNGRSAGVEGGNQEAGLGVWGRAARGIGVKGSGRSGVQGESNERGWAGVYGKNSTDFGYGIVGDGSGSGAGVLGRGGTGVSGSSRFGLGVKGELTEGEGVGVFAKSSTDKGLAGWFEGGRAQLRIKPKGSAGKPTKTPHSQGDLYMDSEAQLFVCTVPGTPGTWRRFQTVAT